jgi:hypothetical protein
MKALGRCTRALYLRLHRPASLTGFGNTPTLVFGSHALPARSLLSDTVSLREMKFFKEGVSPMLIGNIGTSKIRPWI